MRSLWDDVVARGLGVGREVKRSPSMSGAPALPGAFVASLLAMASPLGLSPALAALTGAAAAAEAPFLFDVLQGRNPHRASWERLMKLVQPTPDWLAQFNKNFDGVSGQIMSVTIDGKPYELSFVCKPAGCAEHKFVVLFDASGTRAFGALGGRGAAAAFYGSPSPSEQEAMAKAAQ